MKKVKGKSTKKSTKPAKAESTAPAEQQPQPDHGEQQPAAA